MVRKLEALAGVDAAIFGPELMAARGDLAARSVTDLIESDFKEFDMAGHRVGIAQIESLDVTSLLARRQALIDELRTVRQARGLLQVILLLTDIGRKGSHVWFAGDRRDVLEQALGQPLVDDATYVDGCMSRKKQVVPPLEAAFESATPASSGH